MKSNLWIISLVLLVLVACYSSDHLDVPDKGDNKDDIRTVYIHDCPNSNITQEIRIESACEFENEQLKSEVKDWKDMFESVRCDND